MDQQNSPDKTVLERITELAHEEQRLYGHPSLTDQDQVRLRDIQVALDQCWDLLRQRRARREFGQDPEDAKIRPASVVERYEQ